MMAMIRARKEKPFGNVLMRLEQLYQRGHSGPLAREMKNEGSELLDPEFWLRVFRRGASSYEAVTFLTVLQQQGRSWVEQCDAMGVTQAVMQVRARFGQLQL